MKIESLIIFTNGNCMAFDKSEEQISKYQGNIHKLNMNYIIDNSKKIEISKYGEWIHEIRREESKFLFVNEISK